MKKKHIILYSAILILVSSAGCTTNYSIQVVDKNLRPISDVIVAQPYFRWPYGKGGTIFYKTNNKGCVILKYNSYAVFGKKGFFPTILRKKGFAQKRQIRLFYTSDANNKELTTYSKNTPLIFQYQLRQNIISEQWSKYEDFLKKLPQLKVYDCTTSPTPRR